MRLLCFLYDKNSIMIKRGQLISHFYNNEDRFLCDKRSMCNLKFNS